MSAFHPVVRSDKNCTQTDSFCTVHALRIDFSQKMFCQQKIAIIITNRDLDPLMLIISTMSMSTIEQLFFGNRFLACQGHSPPKTRTQFHLCFEPRTIFWEGQFAQKAARILCHTGQDWVKKQRWRCCIVCNNNNTTINHMRNVVNMLIKNGSVVWMLC